MANITKRGDTYRIRVSSGYDMEGRQLISSTTWKPAPGMTVKQVEKELNRVAVAFEERVRNGKYSANGNMRLAEFCPQYLDVIKEKLSPTTYRSYQHTIENTIIPLLGNLKLKDIRPLHIQRFIQRVGEPYTNGKGAKKV